jgi:uncharacterized protein (DUF1778 family)
LTGGPRHLRRGIAFLLDCGYIVPTNQTEISMATKTKDWKFRVAEDEDKLVKAAVDSSDTKFSSFVRSAAVAEAHRVLADRRSFELDPAAWEEFSDLLERPAEVPEGLVELFSKPSAFK